MSNIVKLDIYLQGKALRKITLFKNKELET
jgi:hypothetical protein